MELNLFKKRKTDHIEEINKITADFINVSHIEENFLYLQNDYVVSFLKIEPVAVDLLSMQEKKALAEKLTINISTDKNPWKLLAIQRAVDLSAVISEYMKLFNNATSKIERDLIRSEINLLNKYVVTGEIMEKQFYFMFWESSTNPRSIDRLVSRIKDFGMRLAECDIGVTYINDKSIAELSNLVTNPKTLTFEDMTYEKTLPIINV